MLKEIHEILAVWNAIILAVSSVTRLAGAVIRAKCICTDSCSIDTIVNSAGTFIDILKECQRKSQRIVGVRKLSQSVTECDLLVYVELKQATFVRHGRKLKVNIL